MSVAYTTALAYTQTYHTPSLCLRVKCCVLQHRVWSAVGPVVAENEERRKGRRQNAVKEQVEGRCINTVQTEHNGGDGEGEGHPAGAFVPELPLRSEGGALARPHEGVEGLDENQYDLRTR